MQLKEYLIQNQSSINCTACGNCCPIPCPNLRSRKLCDQHPLYPGNHGIDKRQDKKCRWTPVEIVLNFAVVCPPVLAVIAEKTGVFLKEANFFCTPHVDRKELNNELEKQII